MNETNFAEAFQELSVLLGDRATTSLAQREQHGKGESHHPGALPDIVCFPHTTEEVSAIVRISASYGVPVIPFGAGTSLEGHVAMNPIRMNFAKRRQSPAASRTGRWPWEAPVPASTASGTER